MAVHYKVEWASIAGKDLKSIISYLAKDSVSIALTVLRKIRRKAASLYHHPQRGRSIPELSHLPGLNFRELIIPPWRLVYRVKGKKVEVLALFDSRRDLSEVLFERLSRI